MKAHACQSCGSRDLESFYEAHSIPAHSCLMMPTREAALAFPRGDLELAFCRSCGFIGNVLFDVTLNKYSAEYEETQSFSPRFLRFLEELCADQIRKHQLTPGKTALEIGCGKGEFLVRLCEHSGCNGIGFDPGYRPERTESPAAGRIEFVRDLYGPKYSHVAADYIACRHTLEHIAPVGELMRLIRQTIGDRTGVSVFFELPDMERVLRDGAFWDVYYEHCTYFTRGSLARLFRARGFDVTSLSKAYDDQYLLLDARPAPGPTKAALAAEDDFAETAALVKDFNTRVEARLSDVKSAVARWRAAGSRFAIWGSGSKCVSLLSKLGAGVLPDAIVDVNPHKHGKFLAGSGYEIRGPAELERIRPNAVLIMNSIYTEEVRADLERRGLRPELISL